MDRFKSILLGAGVTALTLAVACVGLFGLLLWLERSYRDGDYALFLLWPILIPVALASIALGLWASHRDVRRRLAARPR